MPGPSQSASGFVEVEGAQLYYQVTGEGRPLVLIHAGVADHTMWDPQVAAFSQQYKVIRYDTRGFGKTGKGDVSYSNRDDLHALLQHLGVARAAIVGAGRGGQIAMDFTLEHPDMVEALVLAGSGVSGYTHLPTGDEWDHYEKMKDAWQAGDLARLVDLEVHLCVDGLGQEPTRADPELRERIRALNSGNYGRRQGDGTPRTLIPPAAARLDEIRVPTLVIVGELDTPSSVATADLFEEQIVASRKVVFPGVAHLVNLEKPEEFNRALLAFLNELRIEEPTTS